MTDGWIVILAFVSGMAWGHFVTRLWTVLTDRKRG